MPPSWGGGCPTPTGCRNNDVVATASVGEVVPRSPANRPNLVSVGTIVWLSSELMFFAALFAMYFTLRSERGQTFWDDRNSLLNVPFSSVNTTVLVLSSVTCQFGVFAAERGDVKGLRRWFTLTFLM